MIYEIFKWVFQPEQKMGKNQAECRHASKKLERTTEAFRFPGTVIAGTAWRQPGSHCFTACYNC